MRAPLYPVSPEHKNMTLSAMKGEGEKKKDGGRKTRKNEGQLKDKDKMKAQQQEKKAEGRRKERRKRTKNPRSRKDFLPWARTHSLTKLPQKKANRAYQRGRQGPQG